MFSTFLGSCWDFRFPRDSGSDNIVVLYYYKSLVKQSNTTVQLIGEIGIGDDNYHKSKTAKFLQYAA